MSWQWAWETGQYVDGGAAVRKLRKRFAIKLVGTTKKQDGPRLSGNSARLVRTVLLSGDAEFICVDLSVFPPAGLEYGRLDGSRVPFCWERKLRHDFFHFYLMNLY